MKSVANARRRINGHMFVVLTAVRCDESAKKTRTNPEEITEKPWFLCAFVAAAISRCPITVSCDSATLVPEPLSRHIARSERIGLRNGVRFIILKCSPTRRIIPDKWTSSTFVMSRFPASFMTCGNWYQFLPDPRYYIYGVVVCCPLTKNVHENFSA